MEESRVTEGEKIGKTHTPQPNKQLFSILPLPLGLTKGKWNASGTKTAIELIARRSQ